MLQRCLIALALIWAALLFLPPFAPQTARMRAPLTDDARWPYPPLFSPEQLERALQKHPHRGLLEVEKLGTATGKSDALYWRRFDALVARHPTDLAVLRAKMLQATSGGLVKMIWTPAYDSPYSARDLEQSRQRQRQWQNQAQRRVLVEQARAGARLAPDDGFFLWMEAMALWDENDEPALRALERAAQSSRFDDGSQAQRRALLNLREELGPVPWDEKLAAMWAALFPHLAQMRTLQSEVVYSGIAHYRRGDKAGAYRRFRIALKAAATMRRAQESGPQASFIGMLVGEAMQQIVWTLVAKELNPPSNPRRSEWPKEWGLPKFQELARRDGQGALADYAASEAADFQSKKVNPGVSMDSYDAALGWGRPDVRLLLQLPWLERNVFWLSVAGALSLGAALLWRRRLGAAFPRASGEQIAFWSALWTGALGLAAWQRLGPELRIFQNLSGHEQSGPSLQALIDGFDTPFWFWAAIFLTLAGAIGFGYLRHRRQERRLRAQVLKRAPGAAKGVSFWPLLTAIVWVLAILWTIFCGGHQSRRLADRARRLDRFVCVGVGAIHSHTPQTRREQFKAGLRGDCERGSGVGGAGFGS